MRFQDIGIRFPYSKRWQTCITMLFWFAPRCETFLKRGDATRCSETKVIRLATCKTTHARLCFRLCVSLLFPPYPTALTMFDSHDILAQPSYPQDELVTSPDPPQTPELRPALHFQHGLLPSPQASGDKLGIYEAPRMTAAREG